MAAPYDDARATVATQSYRVEVTSGPQAGEVFVVTTLPCTIGRGSQCQVCLQDPHDPPALSRVHCTLDWQDGCLMLRDQSLNGTWVGRERIPRGGTLPLTLPADITLGPTIRLRILPEIENPFADVDSAETPAPPSRTVSGVGLKAQVCAIETLHEAWRKVALNQGAAGVDRVTIRDFAVNAAKRLDALRHSLLRGTYEPLPPRLVALPKRGGGGVRTIAILTVQDRIVQEALRLVLMPLVEPYLASCAYAYRSGVSAHHALRAVSAALARGLTWVAETDIADYFDSISHRVLLDSLGTLVPEAFCLTLIAKCLAACAVHPGLGIAQGAATSPLFSNLYLAAFDQHMLEGGWNPVRYGDDMLFLCASRNRAQAALLEAEGFLSSKLALTLKPEKTAVIPLRVGFTFLGFRFDAAGRRASSEAVDVLQQRLREAKPGEADAVRRGWANYFGEEAADALADEMQSGDEDGDVLPDTVGDAEDGEDVSLAPAAIHNCGADQQALASRIATLFRGREDAYAVHRLRGGKMRVLPCAGSLPLQRLVEHLDGRTTCALYPLLPDGTIYTAVIDIDVAPDVDDRDEAMMYARSFALECTTVAAQHGIAVALEESGGKGYHVWLLFAEALPAETGRQLARLLVAASSVPREGLQVEIFPRHSEWPGTELGDCIKLPFGVHVGTGRRTFLLDDDGERMTDLEDALDSLTLVSARQVKKVIRTLTRQPITAARRPSSTSPDGKVQRLVAQCTVIRALVQRARATGHLRHTHRLILLYTLGRLGAAGAAALHAALASCQNYAHPRTQRYLDTLDATCSPLTCRRVREWLEEDVRDADLCACGTERHMPLDGLLPPAPDDKPPKRQPRAKPPASAESLEAWDAVRQDLFGPDETDAVGEA